VVVVSVEVVSDCKKGAGSEVVLLARGTGGSDTAAEDELLAPVYIWATYVIVLVFESACAVEGLN
jgi:hypothetical protein